MNINLYIEENNRIKLRIISGKREIDYIEWQDSNDLSRLLLTNLNKILQKNSLGVDKISGYKIISEVPRKWTTYRIADITFKTLKIASLAK